MTVTFYKNRFIESGENAVSIQDRAYNYGDGVYEMVRFYGGQGFCLEEHLERLEKSATAIRMKLPYSQEEMHKIVCSAAEKVGEETVDVYFQISRGEAPRLHPFPNTDSVLALFARPARSYTNEFRRSGVAVITLPDERWSNCYIKSLNLLPNVMAKQAAIDAGAFEAVFIRDGFVTEASVSNVFGFHDGIFLTHPANKGILNGITRRCVIKTIENLGYSWKEEAMDEVFFQKEVAAAFLTSTTMEIMPISKINDRDLGSVECDSPIMEVHKAMSGVRA